MTPRQARPVSPAGSGADYRLDLQGLRAVAVLVVVIYHLWPQSLSGGFVGVDVFFVISGFLITKHLWRDIAETGTFSVSRFYAKRALRLLPAAMLVLILTAIATLVISPTTQWPAIFKQIVASSLYLENWILAIDAVDYLAQNEAPSPVQHYWSLSVEEQFYLVWPLLILIVVGVLARRSQTAGRASRRRRKAGTRADIERKRKILLYTLIFLLLISLLYSAYFTFMDPKQAYFVTTTRIWEFCVGALCALMKFPGNKYILDRKILAWIGLFLIVVSSFAISGTVSYPGLIALAPVLGTAFIILTPRSDNDGPGMASWWLARRPMVAIGDISYAIYLWHWPLIVFVPQVVGQSLELREKIFILITTVILAWLSTKYFETPIRTNSWLKKRRWSALAIAVAGVAIVLSLAMIASHLFQAQLSSAPVDYKKNQNSKCLGAGVFDEGNFCYPVEGPGPMMSPVLATEDRNNPDYTRCDQVLDREDVLECEWGEPADTTVALIGDSHATQWLGGMVELAKQGKFRLKTYLKSSCPLTDAVRVIPGEATSRQQKCSNWVGDVKERVRQDQEINLVVTSAYTQSYQFSRAVGQEAGKDSAEVASAGFRSAWRTLTESGKRVMVLRDTPGTEGKQIPDCVATNALDLSKCSTPRDTAVTQDLMYDAAVAESANPRIKAADLSDGMCNVSTCFAVLGNVIVYRDANHLTWQFAETLSGRLYKALVQSGALNNSGK